MLQTYIPTLTLSERSLHILAHWTLVPVYGCSCYHTRLLVVTIALFARYSLFIQVGPVTFSPALVESSLDAS
jgi:hypothetical protein